LAFFSAFVLRTKAFALRSSFFSASGEGVAFFTAQSDTNPVIPTKPAQRARGGIPS
jgi:hypothetical protein